jgi:hypothetical protein
MTVEELMEKHGFRVAASCAGRASYTKWLKYNGRRAYVAVTDVTEEGLPGSLEEPVRVCVFDLKSGDELEPCREFGSLQAYLDSLA